MDSVNKTLYIPLYGKAYVSRKRLFINDKKAEEIWAAEGFPLKGKSASKWLAYYMGIRSAVFDRWVKQQMETNPGAIVLHIGCGMDSRNIRIGTENNRWYDMDFPQVIEERKKYFTENENYRMIAGDAREAGWLNNIEKNTDAIVVMEGVSMYLTVAEMQKLADNLCSHFDKLVLLVDCYTTFAAKMSERRNPVNDVGVTKVYGIDDPEIYRKGNLLFTAEHDLTPQEYIDQLSGTEKMIFSKVYAGSFSKKLYRLYEYKKN